MMNMKKKKYESPSVLGLQMEAETDVIAASGTSHTTNFDYGGDLNVKSTREFSLLDDNTSDSEIDY